MSSSTQSSTRFCKSIPYKTNNRKKKMKPIFILVTLALVAGTFASPTWYNNKFFHVSSPTGATTWDTGSTQQASFYSNELTFNIHVDLVQLEGGDYHFVRTIRDSVSIGTGTVTYTVPPDLAGYDYYIQFTGYELNFYAGPITIKKVGGSESGHDHHD
ncbi:hypothetical protein BC938DRAFT_471715 [Jimgerdemannia flammicorona]|uniref:Ser-Thr-rich glycosyl-phosphatidyl-inositol-anchored membrane family-domain-containing protein n=1 Tax=Jimgerdemannia flammicorona TaxID=994334 RepID=A0A433QUG0_9FUNG|nr:hypothetical protein BC938DRAFT_471715 [Jimgerdemannia flammicorona]